MTSRSFDEYVAALECDPHEKRLLDEARARYRDDDAPPEVGVRQPRGPQPGGSGALQRTDRPVDGESA